MSNVEMQRVVNSIREEVSCCCSLFRYNAINELLDEAQDILDKEQSKLVEERRLLSDVGTD